jgi:hypothetical protein
VAATKIRMDGSLLDRRVYHGPFGQNLFIPNEAWRVQQDLSGAGSGRGGPGSP